MQEPGSEAVAALHILRDRYGPCPRATVDDAFGCMDLAVDDRCNYCLINTVFDGLQVPRA